MKPGSPLFCFFGIMVLPVVLCATNVPGESSSKRHTISLDGEWKIRKGGAELPDTTYEGTAPVPGLADMAKAANGQGEWWWYQREFILNTAPTGVALLKVNKAMFGTQVFLNGHFIGEYLPCFSPSYHDLRPWIHFNGLNTLVIRVGERKNLPPEILNGRDSEKATYTPGIYDSVSLILSNQPHIETVQTDPGLDGTLEVKAGLSNGAPEPHDGPVDFVVHRADNGEEVGRAGVKVSIPARGKAEARATVTVRGCRFWTPEKPFLYVLTTETAGDRRTDRFGMRTFGFNSTTKQAELNGKAIGMLGTNVCLFRFFEDPGRGSLPWNREWVRALVRKFKDMHWNSLRLSLGPPPDFWYDIFDEEGFLVQDEFPIWYGKGKEGGDALPKEISAAQIVSEATPWIYNHCNHPSIYLWDLSNETISRKTKEAVEALRPMDLQGRRWENGSGWWEMGAAKWNIPDNAGDPLELHPYPFNNGFETVEVFNKPAQPYAIPNPLIVNEYGWLWLARDGSPTKLTHPNYEFLVGGGRYSREYGREMDRRYVYATYMAANTEWLRSSRLYAIIHHFSGLSYSRPDLASPWLSGETSDNFLEPVSELQFDPFFESYMRDAFAPVGICIGRYDGAYPAGSVQKIPVSVYNDTSEPWVGEVRLVVVEGGPAVTKKEARAVGAPVTQSFKVRPMEKITHELPIQVPAETGDYTLVAGYGQGAGRVQSIRDFSVGQNPRWMRSLGPNLALNKPAKASSVNPPLPPAEPDKTGSAPVAFDAARAVDQNNNTRWAPMPGEPAWIQVDLGETRPIGMIRLTWERARVSFGNSAHAKNCLIEVSEDEETWKTVAKVTDAYGFFTEHRNLKENARFLRITFPKPANQDGGVSLWEMEVYPPPVLSQ